MEPESLIWEAPEYQHHHHTNDWFWAVGLVGLGLCVTAVILGNVLFGVLVLLGTIALILQAVKHPRHIEFGIGARGVRIMDTLYPHSTLESFWITDDGLLLIRSQKALMPLLTIPLEDVSREEVRDTLLGFIDEEEMHEPISHKIMDALGF